MVAGKSPDWLPPGWTVQVKVKNGRKVTFYSNVETGQRFDSKKDIIRYVQMGNVRCGKPQPMSKHNKRSSQNKPMPIAVKANELPEWLPHGWIMELRTRKSGTHIGKNYKCYIDPATGWKFYSKLEVFRYLKNVNHNSSTAKQKKMGIGAVSNLNIDRLTSGKSSSEPDVSDRLTRGKSSSEPDVSDRLTRAKSSSKPDVSDRLTRGKSSSKPDVSDRLTRGKSSSKPDVSDRLTRGKSSSKPDVSDRLTRGKSSLKPDVSDRLTRGKSSLNPDVSDRLTRGKSSSKPDVSDRLTRGKFSSKPDVSDQLTRDKSSSKPDGSQNRKSILGKSCTSKQEKIGMGKHSTNNVVVEKISPDGLPPGWIKEIKTRKFANGIKRDPYYTDPVSGYIFRSKRDAFRYLETGDIFKCAIKPRKRDTSDQELINDDISSPSAVYRMKLRHHTTRRELFAGKESYDTSSLAVSEADTSKKRQGNGVSADVIFTSTPTAEVLEGKHSLDNANEKCAETKKNSDPKTKGSKGIRDMAVFAKDGSISSPETDILQEQKLPENGMKKHSGRKTQIDSSKSKNKRLLISLPGRSSKRLAGVKPDMLANSGLNERALRAAARKSGETEANPSLGLALDAAAHITRQQFEAEPEMEIAHHSSIGKEAPSDIEPSNKSEKPPEDQALPDKQLRRQETEKQDDEKPESQDAQLFYPFGDSWSDPCLEFAFKTLTGAIPVEDNLVNGYFQQQLDTSQTQKDGCGSHTERDGCLALPEFGLPNFFQNDVSTHFDAPEKQSSVQQLPASPTFLPPGNASLPSCSSTAPQEPSLEVGNKEYQTKVN